MRKNTYYIGLILVILAIGTFAVVEIARRFGNDSVTDANRHTIGKDGGALVKLGKAPSFSFTNQHNQTITDKDYQGKVYVVDFFFVNCPTICPIMSKNMVKIQNAFKDKNIGFASFTINPAMDTPEVLKAYAEQYGVTNPHWHFLTGKTEDIYDLANKSFNIYAGEGDESVGGFEHSGLFALIDQDGNIVCRKDEHGNPIIYYDGLNDEGINILITDIKKLL